MNISPRRFKRGATSLERPGLVFIRYKRGQEVWGTPETLERKKVQARKSNAKRRKKPEVQEYMRDYFRDYSKRPKQKAYQAEYYKQPEVRARYRAKRMADPERLRKVKERARKKAELEEFKTSGGWHARRNQQSKEGYLRNKKKVHAQIAERRRKNPVMRLKQNISRRIRSALKSQKACKSSATVEYLGCSIPEFRIHLEKQFQDGMTWENMGRNGWEIDHRVPLASFNLMDPHQQRLAFHFENLQPLWAPKNRKKSDKLPDGTRGRHIRKNNVIPFREVA